MTVWLAWRLLKWAGLLLLGYAVVGSVWGRGTTRTTAALLAFPLALLTVFTSGFGMLVLRDLGLEALWASLSLLAGVAAGAGAVLHASAPRSRAGAGLALGGVGAAVGFMVLREHGLWLGGVLGLVGGGVGAATAVADAPADRTDTLRWFRWVGRCEGVSLLLLFGVAMPLKYAAGEPAVVEWVGWLHGVFFLLYAAGLLVGMARLGWSATRAGIGLAASLLPFGTFWFERRIR